MFISKIYLDNRKQATAKALYNRGIMHGTLEGCFKGERQHPLWRVEKKGNRFFVLVISKDAPDFSSLVDQLGDERVLPQTKLYDNYLENGIRQGDLMHFRLTANPTIKKDGKRIPLNMKRTENHDYCAADWLRDRLSFHGAELISGEISAFEKHRIIRNQKMITLVSADFDGELKVVDRDKFVDALKNGIGHGKAYGCGMITVMRIMAG